MIEADSIIGGDEWKQIARCFAASRSGFAIGGDRRRFRTLLSPWQIDAICRFVPLPDRAAIRMHFHGLPVSGPAYRDSAGRVAHAAVRQMLEAGASLTIARMEHYSNAVLRLSRALEAVVRCPVQVNLYLTPTGGQGLGSHVDRHDVLVLQLEGEKQWQISAPERDGLAPLPTSSAQRTGDRTETVRAGDWLYLPRGLRHEVRNSGTAPSTHLTIGFHPERALRAVGEPIPASEVPDRDALDAADADTAFSWRTPAVSLTRTANGPELDVSYRRAPLLLYPDLAPWIERMSQVSRFCPRDLDVGDLEATTLLARFLAGAGILALA